MIQLSKIAWDQGWDNSLSSFWLWCLINSIHDIKRASELTRQTIIHSCRQHLMLSYAVGVAQVHKLAYAQIVSCECMRTLLQRGIRIMGKKSLLQTTWSRMVGFCRILPSLDLTFSGKKNEIYQGAVTWCNDDAVSMHQTDPTSPNTRNPRLLWRQG